MTEFMRPTVTTEEVNDTVARYIVEPLERGYGNTLGNSMRRVLLSSLDGAKATAIQIEGVQHEFTTAEGVIEDIADIVLNVKGLVFSQVSDEADGTVEQIEAVDAAEAVAENGAEMTDAEKVEAVEEKKAEEAEAFRETEETAGDPAEAAKEEAEKAEAEAAKEAETSEVEKAEEEKADVKSE